ncbi:restriction endonuclease FokI C-terminal domain-containing protein [Trichococcus shcherbakoviae]|nr:restriction endonuclease FokI C-terminal domain-containing protein [Trichococcus shcherbakoviae]
MVVSIINYWWVTRPKRKLNSVPEVLAAVASVSLDNEWNGQRNTHLNVEEALEAYKLKRIGERRDHSGSGARTYMAWLKSLGLTFTQESTGLLKLTLAGEAILAGAPPVDILKNQVLKYQFPSAYSIGRNINVNPRFKIRPFRFLLRLLNDPQIDYLTQEEIAKIIIVNAENETERCYKSVVERLLNFRSFGESSLDNDFFDKYAPSKGNINIANPYGYLNDIANTLINWMEYTQLAKREHDFLVILEDKFEEVDSILSISPPFIDRPENDEYFQRKYGVDPNHTKDNRNLINSRTITAHMIAEQKITQAFISESLRYPISRIDAKVIANISYVSGFEYRVVEQILLRKYPHGAIGSFMSNYFEMAFRGRDEAIEFETATVEIFENVFGMKANHVGPIGLTPDILVISDDAGYLGIIDNKAYSRYSITNDHKNRMIYNYIPSYQRDEYPLAFFTYIAGGFGNNINRQLNDISSATNVHGSAINVSNMIQLVQNFSEYSYDHFTLKDIFSLDRQITQSDI